MVGGVFCRRQYAWILGILGKRWLCGRILGAGRAVCRDADGSAPGLPAHAPAAARGSRLFGSCLRGTVSAAVSGRSTGCHLSAADCLRVRNGGFSRQNSDGKESHFGLAGDRLYRFGPGADRTHSLLRTGFCSSRLYRRDRGFPYGGFSRSCLRYCPDHPGTYGRGNYLGIFGAIFAPVSQNDGGYGHRGSLCGRIFTPCRDFC